MTNVQPRTAPVESFLLDGRYRVTGRPPGGDRSRHHAMDERLQRTVIVEIFGTDVPPGEHSRTVLGQLAALRDPGIVSVLDAGDDLIINGRPRVHAVLERVAAPSLETISHIASVDAVTLAAIGASVATTLAALHVRGLTHGALRAASILVPEDDLPADPPPRKITKLDDLTAGALRAGARRPLDDLRDLATVLDTVLGGPRDLRLAGWSETQARAELRAALAEVRSPRRCPDAAHAATLLSAVAFEADTNTTHRPMRRARSVVRYEPRHRAAAR